MTKLNSLKSEAADTVTPEHTIRWADQSGQGHGSLAVTPRYATFAVTGFTQTGNTTNTSTTISTLDSSMRPRAGMTVTGAGIPVSTTVVSVDRAANTMVISNAATATAVGVALNFAGDAADPVLAVGYNCDSGGAEIVAGEGQNWIQFEGHYHRESDNAALSETFFAFDVAGSSGQARPIFTWYDKVAKKTLSVDLAPGRDEKLNIYFANYNGDTGGGAAFTFEENIFKINAAPHQTAEDTRFDVNAHSGRSSLFQLMANADNGDTKPTVKFITTAVGGTSQHRTMSISMSDDTAAKTGKFVLRADSDIAGADTVMISVGRTDSGSTALFEINHANMATNYPTFKLVAKASQTRAQIEIDGLAADGTTANARKFQLYPKGYIAVRETANTTTDRIPTVTAPGGGTAKYFPILDENGALYYLTGVPA